MRETGRVEGDEAGRETSKEKEQCEDVRLGGNGLEKSESGKEKKRRMRGSEKESN